MPTYYKDLSYSIHSLLRVTHQLKVIEEPVIPSNQSKLTVSIVRTNSGKGANGGLESLKLTINGDVVYDRSNNTPAIPANSTNEVFVQTYHVPHNTNGTGNFSISVEYCCDWIEGWGVTGLGNIGYWTIASADMSQALTPINQSIPEISDFVISADRYGNNAQTSFVAKHSEYPLTEIKFTLSGLTYEQVNARISTETQADEAKLTAQADGTYSLVLTKTADLTTENSILFDLNGISSAYPLDSGKSYAYWLVITAQNNKAAEKSGRLYVAQKVTGVTCDSSLDLSLGYAEQLMWFVEPANAELQDVIFTSSDTGVANVNENGIITPQTNGICEIKVTTVDGNYSAVCAVNVIDTTVFPILTPVTDYLSVGYLSKIIFACSFVFDELTAAGAGVTDLSVISLQGRQHPITKIQSVFVSIEENCQRLRAAAEAAGVVTTALPSEPQTIHKQNLNWILVVNNWISFLNELHSKINGG